MKQKGKTALVLSVALVAAICLIALLGSHLVLHNPYETNLSESLTPPGGTYPFGTDKLGRCIYSRILEGAKSTILAALLTVFLSSLLGTLLGTAAGFIGGRLERSILAVATMFQAFPQFVLVVAIAGIMGSGLKSSIIALVSVYWVPYARLSRSLVFGIKNSDYIKAARICGAGNMQCIRRYILPNITEPLIVSAAIDIGNVILSLAGLSFLGLGSARPAIEWGNMISEAKETMLFAPWGVIIPGIAIFLVVSAFNLLGENIGRASVHAEAFSE